MVTRHADRLLYGTDFPNIPYAWDRELVKLHAMPFTPAQREAGCSGGMRRRCSGRDPTPGLPPPPKGEGEFSWR